MEAESKAVGAKLTCCGSSNRCYGAGVTNIWRPTMPPLADKTHRISACSRGEWSLL